MGRTVALIVTWMLLGTLAAAFLAGPATGAPMTVHWLADGTTQKTITFNAEGYDSTITLSIRKMSTISMFSMDLEGLPKAMGGTMETDHTFNASTGVSGWDDNLKNSPPTQVGECKANVWPFKYSQMFTNADDGSEMGVGYGNDGSYPCVRLEYTLTSSNPISLRHEFYGYGNAEGGDGLETYAWNMTASTWDLIGTYSDSMSSNTWVIDTIDSGASNYVNSTSLKVTIMMVNLYPNTGSWSAVLNVDFVKLVEISPAQSYPEQVTLDIGGDGDLEWTLTGTLRSPYTVTGTEPTTELQALVDAAGKGEDNITIPLKFYTQAPGLIRVWNISIGMNEHDNQAPLKNGDIPSDKAFDEDGSAAGLINLTQYFTDDIITPGQLIYSIANQSDETKIKAQLSADGKRLDFTAPTPNWFGTQTFKARATDNHGLYTDSNTFTVTVRSVNDVPVLLPIGNQVAKDSVPFSLEVKATDADLGFGGTGGETLNFTISNPLIRLEKKAGTNDTAVISFTPSDAMVGTIDVTVMVKDKAGKDANETFTITVEDVNYKPVFQTMSGQSVTEGQMFKRQAKATDQDARDTITYSDDTDLFEINPVTGAMEYVTTQADVGIHTITLTASDGLDQATLVFNLTVLNKNDAPKIEAIADAEMDRDTEWSYIVATSDQDIGFDPKEKLNLTISSDKPFTTMTIDPATGAITIKAAKKDVGKHVITVKVRDTMGLEAFAKFNMTVILSNDAPTGTITVTTETTNSKKAKVGENITLNATGMDADGDPLTYAWAWTDGEPMTAEGPETVISMNEVGKHDIEVTISDGIETVKVNVTIEITNDGGGGGGGGGSKNKTPGFEAPLMVATLAISLLAVAAFRRKFD